MLLFSASALFVFVFMNTILKSFLFNFLSPEPLYLICGIFWKDSSPWHAKSWWLQRRQEEKKKNNLCVTCQVFSTCTPQCNRGTLMLRPPEASVGNLTWNREDTHQLSSISKSCFFFFNDTYLVHAQITGQGLYIKSCDTSHCCSISDCGEIQTREARA